MSKTLNFRSKKGMSLAVSLVICMFLILVTGSITTVAMLQQNETGSNMNSRQAYISAKSGLDTIKDALNENKITSFPAEGNEQYYVFYYDSTGLGYEIKYSEEAARACAKEISENATKTIVGGEGTYFKIQNENGKYKVTALNVTGKYNSNVSLNRGDLSFDAIVMNTYKVKLKPSPTDPPTDPPTTPPTDPPTTPPGPTDPPTDPPTKPVSGLGGQFLMVGQQTCLNETAQPGNGMSTGITLNSYSKDNNQLFYIPYNENGASGYAYSYFPIVYDKMVKWTAENERASLTAFNQGIYFLGEGSGHKNVDEFYSAYDGDTAHTLGEVSSITQNKEYNPTLRCKFLCIENNFVIISDEYGKAPYIKYSGTDFKDTDTNSYVVAYIPKEIKIMTVATYSERHDGAKKLLKEITVKAGYYRINTGETLGAPICSENTWNTPLTAEEVAVWEKCNLYHTIVNYETTGEIHSGCHETEFLGNTDDRVHIVNNNGSYNTGVNPYTGYSSTLYNSWDYSSARDDQYIFIAPNFSITQSGFYHWYCGKAFNFQWFRTFPLELANGVNVVMSASSIVLTVGPSIVGIDGSTVKVSNHMVEQGTATWKLYGDKGTGAPQAVDIMCPIEITYDNGKTYKIRQGRYTGVPSGLDIFSEDGKNFFTSATPGDLNAPLTASVAYTPSTTYSKAVMPASINAQTTKAAKLFSKLTNGFRLAPMSYVIKDDKDGTKDGKVIISTFEDQETVISKDITSLIYNDGVNDGVQKISVGKIVRLQKEIDGKPYDYITFDSTGAPGETEFKIPDVAGVELDLLNPDGTNMLRARAGMAGANYDVEVITNSVTILKEYY